MLDYFSSTHGAEKCRRHRLEDSELWLPTRRLVDAARIASSRKNIAERRTALKCAPSSTPAPWVGSLASRILGCIDGGATRERPDQQQDVDEARNFTD